jgi:hypothetical protein
MPDYVGTVVIRVKAPMTLEHVELVPEQFTDEETPTGTIRVIGESGNEQEFHDQRAEAVKNEEARIKAQITDCLKDFLMLDVTFEVVEPC